MLKRSLEAVLRRISPGTLRRLESPRVGLDNNDERVAWVRATLQRLPAGLRLLDAGAGEQPYRASCQHLKYVAQDFAQYDGRGDGRGLQMGQWDQTRLDIVSDITRIPEPDGSFDVVLCTEVLEHIADPIKALAEFARLLRPGGTLIVTAPFVSFTHFAPHHYHTGFSRYFYEHHLGELGFELRELTLNGSFFKLLAQELRRIPWVTERYAAAPLTRFERLAVKVVLRALDRLARADRNSSEFAAYGIHVIAVRKAIVPPR